MLACALLLGACGADAPAAPEQPAPGTPPAPVASITFTGATMDLPLGSTRRIVATLRDAQGRVLADRPLDWSSADAAILRVSPAGQLTAIAPGNTVITARLGALAASMRVTVNSVVGGTSYVVTTVDGRALPAIVDVERLELPNGRVVDLLTRLESGIVHLEDRYEVVLQFIGIERELINGRIEHREVGRTMEYDRGRATWNFLDATAVLESTQIGNFRHTFTPVPSGSQVNFRLSGSATTLQLGLAVQTSPAQP
jgi:hypothetical protein